MTEHRWSKFWWQDYESDMALRLVSLSAQGLWMRMLCVMHRATPYGHLRLHTQPMTTGQLSRLVGASESVAKKLLAELEAENVFSRTAEGVIYCRRMIRDKEFSDGMKEIGKGGGNPEIIRGTVPKEDRIRGYKRSDSPRKTQRIFERTNGQCFWCDVPLQRERPGVDFFQVDHVVAVRDGGTNDEDNLVASCAACNHKRARHQSDPNHPTLTGMKSDPKHLDADAEAEEEEESPPPVVPPKASAPRSASPTPAGRGCRIADDWTPADSGFAAEHGVDQAAALAEFRDYWRGVAGKAGVKLDWEATWRNQVRHLSAKKGGRLPVKTSQLPVADQNAELRRIMTRLRGEDDAPTQQPLRIVR